MNTDLLNDRAFGIVRQRVTVADLAEGGESGLEVEHFRGRHQRVFGDPKVWYEEYGESSRVRMNSRAEQILEGLDSKSPSAIAAWVLYFHVGGPSYCARVFASGFATRTTSGRDSFVSEFSRLESGPFGPEFPPRAACSLLIEGVDDPLDITDAVDMLNNWDVLNERRLELIRGRIAGTLAGLESRELDRLQKLAWARRQLKAPLPLEDLSALLENLARKQ